MRKLPEDSPPGVKNRGSGPGNTPGANEDYEEEDTTLLDNEENNTQNNNNNTSSDDLNLFDSSTGATDILEHFGISDEYSQYITPFSESMYNRMENTRNRRDSNVGFGQKLSSAIENNNYGSLGNFNPSEVDSEKEAQLAEIGLRGKQAQSLWSQQQKNIDYKFNRRREQALNKASNKFEQYGKKLQSMQGSSGLNTGNSLLSQANPMEDATTSYRNTMEGSVRGQRQELGNARTQYEGTMNSLGLQRQQIGIDDELESMEAKQQYKDQLFQMLSKIVSMQGNIGNTNKGGVGFDENNDEDVTVTDEETGDEYNLLGQPI